jgi:hypothetical protein
LDDFVNQSGKLAFLLEKKQWSPMRIRKLGRLNLRRQTLRMAFDQRATTRNLDNMNHKKPNFPTLGRQPPRFNLFLNPYRSARFTRYAKYEAEARQKKANRTGCRDTMGRAWGARTLTVAARSRPASGTYLLNVDQYGREQYSGYRKCECRHDL